MQIKQIGRRLYIDSNGLVIFDSGERQGHVIEISHEEEMSIHGIAPTLVSEVIALAYGEASTLFQTWQPPAGGTV